MRSLDIAIVVESLHTHGGVERRTSELVRGLLRAGHRVHIYANRWDGDLGLDVEFHRVPMLRLSRALKASSFAWFCDHRVRGHDLVHTQARILRCDLATLGVGCHRAYMAAMGIEVASAGRDRSFHEAVLRIEKSMFTPGNYRRIITNSAMCKQEVVEHYDVPENDVDVVHNGVDHDRFSPSLRIDLRERSRADLGLAPDDVAVLYLGTGFDRKGLDTLIRALGLLRLPNARLVVVGSGDTDRFGRLAAESGIAGRTIWCGRSNDVARFYSAADIFALPTRYDPFANSTMEALASGVPVITTRSNGVSEILRDGCDAFVIAANDPEALADRLHLLIEDADMRVRIGDAGCTATQPYTWDLTTAETTTTYETLECHRSQ